MANPGKLRRLYSVLSNQHVLNLLLRTRVRLKFADTVRLECLFWFWKLVLSNIFGRLVEMVEMVIRPAFCQSFPSLNFGF